MKAISILIHSVRLLLNNIDAAFRVSLVLYLAIAFCNWYVTIKTAPFADTVIVSPDQIPGAGLFFTVFVLSVLSALFALWIAVAWHRYVLIEELPSGFLPTWHGSYVLSYFWRGFLIGLLIVVIALVVMLVLGLFNPFLATAATVVIALIVFYRLCPVLPASSLGKSMSFSQAWETTRGQSGTIVVLALLGGVAAMIMQLPTMLGGDAGGIVNLVYSTVIGWFTMMIGISVLTTFYGHFVEGRDIE